jgi:hypothetical protein
LSCFPRNDHLNGKRFSDSWSRAPKRKRPRPLVRRFGTGWKDVLVIVTPDTVVAWHRTAFRRYLAVTLLAVPRRGRFRPAVKPRRAAARKEKARLLEQGARISKRRLSHSEIGANRCRVQHWPGREDLKARRPTNRGRDFPEHGPFYGFSRSRTTTSRFRWVGVTVCARSPRLGY